MCDVLFVSVLVYWKKIIATRCNVEETTIIYWKYEAQHMWSLLLTFVEYIMKVAFIPFSFFFLLNQSNIKQHLASEYLLETLVCLQHIFITGVLIIKTQLIGVTGHRTIFKTNCALQPFKLPFHSLNHTADTNRLQT